MNLRQIVRNQKLQNFNYNLSDFITEADDEEVEKKDAFAGKTDAKEPKNSIGMLRVVSIRLELIIQVKVGS